MERSSDLDAKQRKLARKALRRKKKKLRKLREKVRMLRAELFQDSGVIDQSPLPEGDLQAVADDTSLPTSTICKAL